MYDHEMTMRLQYDRVNHTYKVWSYDVMFGGVRSCLVR